MSVAGKSILITGAARGIGADAARRLAERGARIALVGLEPSELEKVAADCPGSIWIEADVTDPEAMAEAAERTAAELGGIDVVVANAGIGGGGFVELTDPGSFERTIEVDLLGVWRTVRACLPYVIERQGYVLNVASVLAMVHAPGMAAYCAAKAGVEAFSNSLRLEMTVRGVDVGVAYFSWIGTDLVNAADEKPGFSEMRKKLKGAAGRTYPTSHAGKAILAGVENRSRIVVAPRWVRYLLPFRGLLTRLVEREALKNVPEAERLMRAEIDRVGAEEASRPVGPGGEAAMRESNLAKDPA